MYCVAPEPKLTAVPQPPIVSVEPDATQFINFYLTHTITTVAPDSIVSVEETVNGPAKTALEFAFYKYISF